MNENESHRAIIPISPMDNLLTESDLALHGSVESWLVLFEFRKREVIWSCVRMSNGAQVPKVGLSMHMSGA